MEHLKELTLLCVDDDELVLEIYEALFSALFKRVVTAVDGLDAKEKFLREPVDIVLTDYSMPRMNGLGLVEEIRKKDFNIPVLMVTAFEDFEMLQKALDLNVTAFIKKPLEHKLLFSKLELISKSIIAERLLLQQQESTIAYSIQQESLGFAKQKKIAKVDLKEFEEWRVAAYYKPKEILSGDSYLSLPLQQGAFFFLIDAMGKGISASVTANIATAFVKYLVQKGLDFSVIIDEFLHFIRENLLEEESLSAHFLFFSDAQLSYSSFGMPPVLYEVCNSVEKLRSNNPPLSCYTENYVLESVAYKSMQKILLYSDGLNEVHIKSVTPRLYTSQLKEDFLLSHSLEELLERRKEKIVEQEDDVTLFFIQRSDCQALKSAS